MTWALDSAKKIKENGDTLGIRLVFLDGALSETKDWGIGGLSYGALRKMVLGQGGSVQQPGGEALAWLDHLNKAVTTEDDA